MSKKCFRITIAGIVQGVGYRPHIFRLAQENKVTGWVSNTTEGVLLEAEGEEKNLKSFIRQLKTKIPPLAAVSSIAIKETPPKNYAGFIIKGSFDSGISEVIPSPDTATCPDCQAELLNKKDRRYRYPFINCVNCGPRFTIIEDLPYDRKNTTMQDFKMCARCQAEYDNPADRRFHTQPNACFACGPQVTLYDRDKRPLKCTDPIAEAVQILGKGRIVAVKGVGGYHLMCDAANDRAVGILRLRKKREFKPFALMCRDLKTAEKYCEISAEEKKLLESPLRPIVLLPQRKKAALSARIAPGNNLLGIMLPYAPLHILLFEEKGPEILVATSGNLTDEPLICEDDTAFAKLKTIADYFLVHNRPISIRCDDSILAIIEKQPLMLRRARGFVPSALKLKNKTKNVMGCGAELKNTFCFLKEDKAFVSQYIGDLKNYEVYEYYQQSIQHYLRLFRFSPDILAYDLHPSYLSTEFALNQPDTRLIGVQHHHAHIASCLAENKVEEKVIGVALDGVGYGVDGKIWGFEFLGCDLKGFDRLGHLKYSPMPGGDVVSSSPFRMALSYLYQIFEKDLFKLKLPLFKNIPAEKINTIIQMVDQDIHAPQSSSCGRLFDAVSALLGIRYISLYEAQAAIELEMTAKECRGHYPYKIKKEGEVWVINPLPAISALIEDFELLEEVPKISYKFHNTIVKMVLDVCEKIRGETKLNRVALSGGCFQNRILAANVPAALVKEGFKIYTHKLLPPNDGGISLGQAVVASHVSTSLPSMPGVDLWYIKPKETKKR